MSSQGYGIKPEGFNRKRLDVLLEELNSEMKSVFGDNLNVSPQSPDGQINGVISEVFANFWEMLDICYNSLNPDRASDDILDNLVSFNGLTRLDSFKTKVELTFTGDPGTLIPSGSSVKTSDTLEILTTDSNYTIGSGGTVVGMATASVDGEITIQENTVTLIETPISGWDSVNNATDGIPGRLRESDSELRARRKRSFNIGSFNTWESLYANIGNLDGVSSVSIYENDTSLIDSNGLPPHSFMVIVEGGDSVEIANEIWSRKPAGIKSAGNNIVQVFDSLGFSHSIAFSRPNYIDIYVKVELDKFSTYPSDGDNLVKQAIVDYSQGTLIEGRSFGTGDKIVTSRLYSAINTVIGHDIELVEISTSPNPSSDSNIDLNIDENPVFSISNIEVI